MQYAALGDTVYFHFAANNTGGDGADPTALDTAFFVRKAGAAANAAPVWSGDITSLTHALYPAGCAEIGVVATAGNGFEAGATYAVFCSVTVGGANPTGYLGSFTLNPVPSTVTETSRDEIASALLNLANGVETGTTMKQSLRAILAMASGSVTGAGTTTEVFTAPDGTTIRLTFTVDSSGNRTCSRNL